MSVIANLKINIAKLLEIDSTSLIYPPESHLGDLSYPCFSLAKSRGINPVELAGELKAMVEQSDLMPIFEKVVVAGPYLNFYIKSSYIAKKVLTEIKQKGRNYGMLKAKIKAKKKVMIEYSNGNTHKEYHVGHLRNIAYGEAVKNILNTQGCQSIPVSYINDFGIHVAKTVWNWRQNPVFEERPENKGFLLGKCYTEASKKLSENPDLKEEVSVIMKSIEKREGADYDFWKISRSWSIDYFDKIYRELGIRFADTFYESDVIESGLVLVQDLLAKGILQESEGAIIADLSKYDLGVLPIIRSDKTALYPVADLALANEKFSRYDLDTSIYVVDIRQSQYFKQLFKVLELAGYKESMIHLSYDFVTLPEGMMASRTGNVITYEDLKSKLIEKLLFETKKRHQDWKSSKSEKIARSLAISTIKFEMLKVGAEKIITFNIEEAARSEGYTACYVLYGYTRIRSIMRKGGLGVFQISPALDLLKEDKEKELIMKMAKFAEVLELSASKHNPAELVKYLFELVQLFNDYYHNHNILKADRKLRIARLALLKNLSTVLLSGFSLIGLEPLEEM